MTDKTRAMDVHKKELKETDQQERTRDRRVFIPRADIYETENEIVVVTDIPGCDEHSIDITLEKNVLKINGFVEPKLPEGYTLTYAEYGIGDYQRTFALSDEIDREQIDATVKDGVLRLVLPKAGPAKTHKISVKPL
jgi:HSP20 family protein